MCSGNPNGFSRSTGIPLALVKPLECTAEHLVARQDGGRESAENIVAACRWCNLTRHRCRPQKAPDAETYRMQVLRKVAAGKWHPIARWFARQGANK